MIGSPRGLSQQYLVGQQRASKPKYTADDSLEHFELRWTSTVYQMFGDLKHYHTVS